MQAFQAALQSSIDTLEFDIRLTKDHKWVVVHNPFFKSEEKMIYQVHEQNYTQLRREVTRLDHVLALFAAHGNGKELMVDVKDVGEERQLVRLIQNYGLEKQVIVIGWEPEILRRVHKIEPSIRLGLTYIPIHSTLKMLRGTINRPVGAHKVILNFNAEQSFSAKTSKGLTHHHYLSTLPDLPLHCIQVREAFCSSKLVKLAHEKGFKVYPFVVNTRLGAALLKRRGVDGIITNYPKTFIKAAAKTA